MIQLQPFRQSRMGERKGYALENVRLGFCIPQGRYASAKLDMMAQKKAGTLHPFKTLPSNVYVPIYVKPKIGMIHASPYGFVFVIGNGKVYSDGKRMSENWLENIKEYYKLYWGEFCDGIRVVK